MQLPAYLPHWLKSIAAAIFHVDLRPLAFRDTLPDQPPPPREDPIFEGAVRGQATQRAHAGTPPFRE